MRELGARGLGMSAQHYCFLGGFGAQTVRRGGQFQAGGSWCNVSGNERLGAGSVGEGRGTKLELGLRLLYAG